MSNIFFFFIIQSLCSTIYSDLRYLISTNVPSRLNFIDGFFIDYWMAYRVFYVPPANSMQCFYRENMIDYTVGSQPASPETFATFGFSIFCPGVGEEKKEKKMTYKRSNYPLTSHPHLTFITKFL